MGAAVVTYRCPRCEKYLDDAGIKQIPAGSGFVRACMTCGGALVQETSREARSLPGVLAGAFAYPFRGSTLMWVAGMIVVTTALSFFPFLGGLLAISVELGFLFTVLKSTAAGSDELQVDTTELSDVSTWLRPLAKYLFAALLSFGPAILAAYAMSASAAGGGAGVAVGESAPTASGSAGSSVVLALTGLGLLYFPAALVLAAHESGCLGVLNPIAGFKLIARIPGAYFSTVFFVAVALSVGGAMIYVATLLDVPLVGAVARSIASLYGPVVAMRMLGLLVHENAEQL